MTAEMTVFAKAKIGMEQSPLGGCKPQKGDSDTEPSVSALASEQAKTNVPFCEEEK